MPCIVCGLSWGGYGKVCDNCNEVDIGDPYRFHVPPKHEPIPAIITMPEVQTPAIDYAFTLTAAPDMNITAQQFTAAAEKILKFGLSSKYEKPERAAYVLEYTQSGTPHIHGVYRMTKGRRILQKYFKRHWPHWKESVSAGHGHRGGYHQKARHTESYENYMEKEGIKIVI